MYNICFRGFMDERCWESLLHTIDLVSTNTRDSTVLVLVGNIDRNDRHRNSYSLANLV